MSLRAKVSRISILWNKIISFSFIPSKFTLEKNQWVKLIKGKGKLEESKSRRKKRERKKIQEAKKRREKKIERNKKGSQETGQREKNWKNQKANVRKTKQLRAKRTGNQKKNQEQNEKAYPKTTEQISSKTVIFELDRLSKMIILCEALRNSTQAWLPMYPSPPVIRTVRNILIQQQRDLFKEPLSLFGTDRTRVHEKKTGSRSSFPWFWVNWSGDADFSWSPWGNASNDRSAMDYLIFEYLLSYPVLLAFVLVVLTFSYWKWESEIESNELKQMYQLTVKLLEKHKGSGMGAWDDICSIEDFVILHPDTPLLKRPARQR